MGHGTEARRAAKRAKAEALTDKLADAHDSFSRELGCEQIVAQILIAMARREADGDEKIKTALSRRRLERYATWHEKQRTDGEEK